MAAAARPGLSEARVPCPLCGGLVHPIAGKCKHCKADLTSYHAARPAATAPLPSLQPSARNGVGNAQSSAPTNGHAPAVAASPGPVGMMVAAAREAAQPVLPPRPSPAYPTPSRPSSWRSWPVLVIVLAVLAIVAALVLMAWPEGRGPQASGKRALPPPPAPERMQTVPELKPPPIRPPVVQPAQPVNPPSQDPSDLLLRDPDAASDDDDSARAPGALPDPSGTSLPHNRAVTTALLVHVCQKLDQCGTVDPTIKLTCDAVSGSQAAPPVNCPAAIRCLARIDALPCSTPSVLRGQLDRLFHQPNDCTEVIRC